MYATEKKLNNTPYADVLDVAADVFDHTAIHNGATFTHDHIGGWTVYEGDGYAVGGYQDTVTVDLNTGNGEPVYDLAEFIQRIPVDGNGDKRYLVGTWIEDGVLYIDAVQIWAELDDALSEGDRLKQDAVYGFREGESFYLKDYVKLNDRWEWEQVDGLGDEPEADNPEPEKTVTRQQVLDWLNLYVNAANRNAEHFEHKGEHGLGSRFRHQSTIINTLLVDNIDDLFR